MEGHIQVSARVDFRLDGKIVPLSYICPDGEAFFVKKIHQGKRQLSISGQCEWYFLCTVEHKGLKMHKQLLFSEDAWYLCNTEFQ